MTLRPVRPRVDYPQPSPPPLTVQLQLIYRRLSTTQIRLLIAAYDQELLTDPHAQERADFLRQLLQEREDC